MISALVPLILEAALRALLAAVAVWAGLRLLSIGNVLAQKAAWGLVLVAALAMPLAPHWQALPTLAALRLPPLFSSAHPSLQAALPATAAPQAAPADPVLADDPADRPRHRAAARPLSVPRRSIAIQNTAPPATTPAPAPPVADRFPAPAISSSAFDSLYDSTRQPASYAPQLFSTPQPHASKTSPTLSGPAALAWVLYLGIFTGLFLRLLFGLAAAIRLWIVAKPISGSFSSEPALGLRLRSSTRVASPVNIASGIVLPADYSSWDEEKLRIVLAHERSHIRQGDFYLQLVAGFYSALFWFSPLGWWLKHKLSELSEAISDRAGLEEAASRSSYAQILLEFAALPRPTLTGVAMARTSHLAQRIERLLNESSFRQAFAAGGRRAVLAVLLVPAALLAATALVRVEAAAAPVQQDRSTAQAQSSAQEPIAGQSTPEQVTQPAPAPAAAPASEGAPVPPPLSPSATPSPDAAPGPPPPAGDAGQGPGPEPPNPEIGNMPPMPDINVQIPAESIHVHIDPAIRTEIAAAREEMRQYRNYSGDGEPWALVGDPGSKPRLNGRWDDGDRMAEIEKARKTAHGHFLWFNRDGKSYIVDDPAIVTQLEAMNKPMDDLSTQMHALGDQMRALGEQQRELGKQMRDITVPTPDLSKEMAELNAAVASLKAKQGGTISQKDLGDLQREFGRIQGELGALQGKIGAQQGELGGNMGKFGGQMGELGGQMGKLGAQMGQLARENQSKVNKIIDESLKDGKARPVE